MFTITEVQQVLHGEQGQSINSYNKNISGFDSGIFLFWKNISTLSGVSLHHSFYVHSPKHRCFF